MTTIIQDITREIVSLRPAFLSKHPQFNFITIHYFYIIGMAILGSISLYINGNMRYIDALFFGSGAATQSGLNTIDINLLNTWQQIVLTMGSMMCNPIAINTAVVVLRLLSFEKRFQHVVKEAKKGRRSLAKTFSKAKSNQRDMDGEERGVGDRSITVMHHTTRPNGMTNRNATPQDLDDHLREKERAIAEEKARSSNDTGASKDDKADQGENGGTGPRQIKFADEVRPSKREPSEDRLPAPRSKEDHIAILQRQRDAEVGAGAVLRIPGPRDADAGIAPQPVDRTDDIHHVVSRNDTLESLELHELHRKREPVNRHDDPTMNDSGDHSDNDRPRRGITIEEPTGTPSPVAEHVVENASALKNVLGVLRFRKPRVLKGTKLHDHEKDNSRSNTLQTLCSALSHNKEEGMPYLSWEATVGRNSLFIDLDERQREELGGIEYRSLKTLLLILALYFWGFMIFGIVCLTPWIIHSKTYGVVVTNVGQGRPWWGIFTTSSAFTDMGFTLTPDSMVSFQAAIWPLLLMSFLIIIGNTGFPIMLRIIIWVTAQWVPKDSGVWEELKFLLDHPRRCFTLLFPSKATWWLFWILVILNGVDLIFFIILDLGNTIVTQLPINIRVIDGWFQAVSTRTAGFAVVNLALLHPAIQVSYMIMMYISVLPIAISVRRTNVYEENSLGIYGTPAEEGADEAETSYVGAHVRRQLSFDLWFIFMGFFIISISEGSRLQSGDPNFTMFAVLFEVISAYGTVGLSLGYPGINASFSAEFGVIAKLVIIAMQIRGRHRGLPYGLDKAILLPSEHLQEQEAQDAARMARRRSSAGAIPLGQMNSAGTANGTAKTNNRSESRERTQNILSSLLHPGPTIPSSHRNVDHRTDPLYERSRKSSVASKRHESPMGGDGVGDDDEFLRGRGRKNSEGRRSFFQEGVNPEPKDMKQQ